MSAPDVSVRYLLVELPLMTEESSGFDPDEQFYRIRNDVSEFLWEDPALAEPPTVALIYSGDMVPDGSDDVTIRLTREQAIALGSSFDSAERGREDFDYLASLDAGDYEPEDVEAARIWHARQVEVEAAVMAQLTAQVGESR